MSNCESSSSRLLLSVIIVSFNAKDLLIKCLQSLADNELPVGHWEIIVVDNSSTDGSVKEVKNWKLKAENKKLKIRIIENKENLGFSRAVNQGIRITDGEYILLLNPDIIIHPGAIQKLLDFAYRHPEAGLIAGRLVYPDNSPQASVFRLPSVIGAVGEYWLGQKGRFEKYLPSDDQPSSVEAVVGAVMLIPKKIIDLLGGFDERYFMYFEDLDFCRRLKCLNLEVYYLPSAVFTHYHGASSQKVSASANRWIVESSKIYHGLLVYWLITLIIKISQLWRKYFGKTPP